MALENVPVSTLTLLIRRPLSLPLFSVPFIILFDHLFHITCVELFLKELCFVRLAAR